MAIERALERPIVRPSAAVGDGTARAASLPAISTTSSCARSRRIRRDATSRPRSSPTICAGISITCRSARGRRRSAIARHIRPPASGADGRRRSRLRGLDRRAWPCRSIRRGSPTRGSAGPLARLHTRHRRARCGTRPSRIDGGASDDRADGPALSRRARRIRRSAIRARRRSWPGRSVGLATSRATSTPRISAICRARSRSIRRRCHFWTMRSAGA